MRASRLMVPTAVLAGLLAAVLLAVTTTVASAQEPPPVTRPSIPEMTVPEATLPEVTFPALPDLPELPFPASRETPLPDLSGATQRLETLSMLVDTFKDVLSGVPMRGPVLTDLLDAVVGLLTELLGGAGPGAAPQEPTPPDS